MHIAVQGLRKSFSSKLVLNNINFSLSEGQCLVVTGKNGAGKTTLLRCLGDCLSWDDGQLLVDNTYYHNAKHLKYFSYFNCEEGSYLPHLSFEENLHLHLHMRGLSKAQVHEGFRFVETFLPFQDLLKENIQSLSRGGQQMFFLLRSLCDLETKVFILDEPFTHLDSNRTAGVLTYLGEILKTGKTVFTSLQENQLHLMQPLPHSVLKL